MRFTWDESYDVGVEKFNEQHRHFFEISNSIYDLVEKGEVDREELMAPISELINYGLYHMSAEEGAFHKYSYPKTEEHIEAHNFYRQKTQEYLEKSMDLNINIVTLAKEIADFASDWLFEHIRLVDKQYSSFLEGKEID